jgi:hypothetical protein
LDGATGAGEILEVGTNVGKSTIALAFAQKEKAAKYQNNIAAGYFIIQNRKPGLNQAHYPHDTKKQSKPAKHRQTYTQPSGFVSLLGG